MFTKTTCARKGQYYLNLKAYTYNFVNNNNNGTAFLSGSRNQGAYNFCLFGRNEFSQARARLKNRQISQLSRPDYLLGGISRTRLDWEISRKSVPNNCALYDGIELAVKPLCTHAHGNPFRNAPIISLCTSRLEEKCCIMPHRKYVLVCNVSSAFSFSRSFRRVHPAGSRERRGSCVCFSSTEPRYHSVNRAVKNGYAIVVIILLVHCCTYSIIVGLG